MLPSPSRNISLSCLVIFVVICLFLSVVSIIGAGVIFFNRASVDESSAELPGETAAPLAIDEQMDQIEIQVSDLRGLVAKSSVSRNLLSPQALRQRVLDDFLSDYTEEDAREDALVLWSFGLIEREFDLYNFYLELFSEQIAGYYDQETKEMYVVQSEAFAGPERLTYAHEFVHALQDQYYDIENGLQFNAEDCKNDSERCAAVSALLEGDASLTESLWFAKFATHQDQVEISQFYSTFESPVFDSAPAFMKEDFIFPYQQGKDFVQSIFDAGGWEAVNQVYLQPPVTTEQILHPEQYPHDIPSAVEVPDLVAVLGSEWDEIDRGVMGEWYTYLILSAGLEAQANIPQSEAQTAAAGWEGDTYVVLYNENQDQVSLVLLTQWASDADVVEFERSFSKYAASRFGETISHTSPGVYWQSSMGVQAFFTQDGYTAWVVGADFDAVERIWEQLIKP
jgi:hypothetical protein